MKVAKKTYKMERTEQNKENASLVPPERSLFLGTRKSNRPLSVVNTSEQQNRISKYEKRYTEESTLTVSKLNQPGPSIEGSKKPTIVSNVLLHPQVFALKKNDAVQFVTPVENKCEPPVPENIKLQHGNTNVVAKFFNMSRAEFTYNTESNEDYFQTLLQKDLQIYFRYDADISVTHVQWDVIYKWIMQIHVYLHYSSSNLYQTMKLFHSFLQLENVDIENLQIVALACMWIVLKTHGSYPQIPNSKNIVVLMKCGEKHENLKSLLRWEKKILTTMDFHCSFIDVNTVISYFLINLRHVSDTKTVYYIACYMVDVAMFRKNCCRIPTVALAAAATAVACLIKHQHLDLHETTREISAFHQNNVTELILRESYMLQHKLVSQAKNSLKSDDKLHIVFEKYQNERFGKVSAVIKKQILLTDVKLSLAVRSTVM